MESHSQTVVKDQKSNDELQDARKELIYGLLELTTGRSAIIDIKGMGVLDPKAFTNACKGKF